jgi:hypothetical protein
MRFCKALFGKECLEWAEPIVSVATSQVKDATRLPALAEEQCLILPLAYDIKPYTTLNDLRLLADHGKVTERLESETSESPLNRLTVLLVTARKASL